MIQSVDFSRRQQLSNRHKDITFAWTIEEIPDPKKVVVVSTVTETPTASPNQAPGISGLHYFTNGGSKNKKRFWLLVYVTCITLCIVHVSERVQHFFNYPMSMTLTAQKTTSWRYPDITVCPFHAFHSGRIAKELKAHCPKLADKGSCPDVFDLLGLLDHNITALWSLTGNDLWDTVVECRYEGNLLCNESKYWKVEHTVMGQCYTLSIPEKIVHGGPWLGVHILLKDLHHLKDIALAYLQWKVLLHEQNVIVEYSTLSRSTPIYKKARTALTFWKKEYYHENVPVDPCSPSKTVLSCLADCYDRRYLRSFKCRLPFMKTLTKVPLCTEPDEFRAMFKFSVDKAQDFRENVESCGCDRPCHEVKYELKLDSNSETMPGHTGIVVNPIVPQIEIVRERRAYPLNSFISDMGGTLGLYLGVCILTIMETVRFAFRAIVSG